MKKLFLSFVLVLFSTFSFAQNTWSIDQMHSSVNFTVEHMGISFVQGRFDKFTGSLKTKGNSLDNAVFDISIHPESINTGVEMRDKHLKSKDFFAAEEYNEIKFTTASISKEKDGSYVFTGKLTIKDVTKEISVPVILGGITKNKEGKEIMGMQAKFSISRFDYGLNYDPTAAGIAKHVEITTYLELVKR